MKLRRGRTARADGELLQRLLALQLPGALADRALAPRPLIGDHAGGAAHYGVVIGGGDHFAQPLTPRPAR